MKRIKIKKKIGKTKKNNNLLLYSCVILSILLVFFMLLVLFNKQISKFKIVSRNNHVVEHKKTDTEEYETVGWIRVQGTDIDYPIINVLDYEYGHPVTGKSYSWLMNNTTKFKNRIDIAGHNILNLSVNPVRENDNYVYFEELKNYVYPDFVKENQFIQLNIDGKDYLYQVFAVNIIPTYRINEYVKEYESAEIKEFLDYVKEESFYDFDLDVNENDNILSLHTCTRFYGVNGFFNFVVTGKLIENEKEVELAEFKTTKYYDKILKIMNGGEVDE